MILNGSVSKSQEERNNGTMIRTKLDIGEDMRSVCHRLGMYANKGEIVLRHFKEPWYLISLFHRSIINLFRIFISTYHLIVLRKGNPQPLIFLIHFRQINTFHR